MRSIVGVNVASFAALAYRRSLTQALKICRAPRKVPVCSLPAHIQSTYYLYIFLNELKVLILYQFKDFKKLFVFRRNYNWLALFKIINLFRFRWRAGNFRRVRWRFLAFLSFQPLGDSQDGSLYSLPTRSSIVQSLFPPKKNIYVFASTLRAQHVDKSRSFDTWIRPTQYGWRGSRNQTRAFTLAKVRKKPKRWGNSLKM